MEYTSYEISSGKIMQVGSGKPYVEDGWDYIPGKYDSDKYRIISGVPQELTAEEQGPPLPQIIHEGLNEINRVIGGIRTNYITVAPGMDMHYMEKKDQAHKCVNDLLRTNEKYPLLASEIGVTASDLNGVAQVILQKYSLFVAVESALNSTRIAASYSIQNATTKEQVQQALTTFYSSLRTKGFIQ